MASSSHLDHQDLHQFSMRDVETMDILDLLETVKTAIEKSRDRQRVLAEDIVRVLKFKRGLILADQSSATQTHAERGLSYESTKIEMDKVLGSLRYSIDADAASISSAVEKYFDTEKLKKRPEKVILKTKPALKVRLPYLV